MIETESSLFAGGPLPPAMSKAAKLRMAARDQKWRAATAARAGWTADQKADVERRLAEEIATVLAKKQARHAA